MSVTDTSIPSADDTAFRARHIGPSAADEAQMLQTLGYADRASFIDAIVPQSIRRQDRMALPAAVSEEAALHELKRIAGNNQVLKSFIGQGYYACHTPGVILRNILENPAWYTAYTPYQAEISQGRLEALLNFQTLVADLTAMTIANASMLDEATAAAEAMYMAKRSVRAKGNVLVVSGDVHPQTLHVLHTRAEPLGLQLRIAQSGSEWDAALAQEDYFAALVQYPASSGWLADCSADAKRIHAKLAALIVASDLLALTLLKAPGEMGADIVVGSSQRFGMPMGAGGPHAAFLACGDSFKRAMPGRLVGVSKDVHGQPALRLALQTREQHIRRDKATSNICTAQVLPAIVASMYALYHGGPGLRAIAARIAQHTAVLHAGLQQLGYVHSHAPATLSAFDTLCLKVGTDQARSLHARAIAHGANIRLVGDDCVGISLDETSVAADVALLWRIFAQDAQPLPDYAQIAHSAPSLIPASLQRQSAYLTHPVFAQHHSETAMLRYIRALSDQDLALDRSMIPLGSCTMKLNASSEMLPITWPEFANVHPYAPADQLLGYAQLDAQLRSMLCSITGYAAVSLQPNAGSQGEYAGLLAIRAYHRARGQPQRTVCLIPASAHGTNPASAVMAGMRVVVVQCDALGNVDMDDLRAQCLAHSAQLACMMITYPSTHGVFETHVPQLCQLIKQHGGRVYIDGANMNALVGLAAPGAFGGDVSHLNLHKTFCVPHGGGGPGVGPVCVAADLAPYLPQHISAAPLGNAAVLPITWMYLRMMGASGLQHASESAMVSANYISRRLQHCFPTLYHNAQGLVAHECILDIRALKERSGISAEDVAKRLMDYGFHAPTLSFPVAGTLMVEPTESEPLAEIERFIAAMRAIYNEILQVEQGHWPRDDNPLVNAPHTMRMLSSDSWEHAYPRSTAAWPYPARNKYFAPVGRVDNAFGDRNVVCACPPLAAYQ